MTTDDPARAFAPQVDIARDEHWRPMSAKWFLDRAVFHFAEDQGCDDRTIAVGQTLGERQNEVVNWIVLPALGKASVTYYRNPYDTSCEPDSDVIVHANQLTRPHDRSGDRAGGLRPGEGFYLDLLDGAQPGPDRLAGTPVYVERTDEGDSGIRLTYWVLHGMSAPPGRPAATHEGDWERIDVLLSGDRDGPYEPHTVQSTTDAGTRDVPWSEVARDGTHPVVTSAVGSHELSPARPGERCADCVAWRSWRDLEKVRAQPWYGFGGAWGGVGESNATTGPLGPHGFWPPDID